MARGRDSTGRGVSWTAANLGTQGYRLTAAEARALRVGLRFPTALCLLLVVIALLLQSVVLVALLVPVAAVAALLAADATTAALVLGGVLVAVCGLVTATNFCIPSTLLSWIEARRRPAALA